MKLLKKFFILSFALILACTAALTFTSVSARNGESGDTKVQPILAFNFTKAELDAANGEGFAPTIGDAKYTLKFRDHWQPTGKVLNNYTFIEGGGVDFRQSSDTWNNDERFLVAMDQDNDIYDNIGSDFTISMDVLAEQKSDEHWSTVVGTAMNASKYLGIMGGNDSPTRLACKGLYWDGTEYASKGSNSNSGVQETGWKAGEFNHVVISVNPTNGKLKSWCNGVLTVDITIDSTFTVKEEGSTSTSFSIGGAFNGGGAYYASGAIKNLEFYDFALDTEQLEWAFNERGYVWQTDLGEQKVLDPIAKYEFNDAENAGKDTMGKYDLDVVVGSGVTVADGKATIASGSGLVGSATNDVADALAGNDFTIVYTGQATSAGGFAFSALTDYWGNGQGVCLNSWGGQLRAACSDSTGYLAGGKTDNCWGDVLADDLTASHVVVVTKTANEVKYYIDGVLKNTYAVASMNLASSATRFSIGGQYWDGMNLAASSIVDEVRIYNIALTADEISELAKLGDIYELSYSTVASVDELDLSSSIVVPSNASDELIIAAYAPKAGLIDVTMTTGVVTKATVTWDKVVKEEDGTVKLEGTLSGVTNDNDVKAYAVIGTKDNCVTIRPLAKYNFASTETMLVDEMGNFPLEVYKRKVATKDEDDNTVYVDCDNADVKAADGSVVFDGNYALINKDLGKYLGTTATISFEMELSGTTSDWSAVLGFGQNNWSATSFAKLQFSGSSDLLRLSIGNRDENTGNSTIAEMTGDGYWGKDVKNLGTEKHVITLVLGDNDHVKVYVDGELINDYAQNGFTLDFADSVFAIGGVYDFAQFINNCKVSNVSIYDFALTAEMIRVLNATGEIQTNQYNGAYVTEVASEVSYEGEGVLTGTVRAEDSEEDILAKAKEAKVTATLNNGETKDLTVLWTGVDKENSRLIGTILADHTEYGCDLANVYAAIAFESKLNVTVEACTNGTVVASASSAYAGDTITLTVTADANYKISSVKVNGNEIEEADGVYSFTLEADSVVVASFEKDETPSGDITTAPEETTTAQEATTTAQGNSTSAENNKSSKKGCSGLISTLAFIPMIAVCGILITRKRREE